MLGALALKWHSYIQIYYGCAPPVIDGMGYYYCPHCRRLIATMTTTADEISILAKVEITCFAKTVPEPWKYLATTRHKHRQS
jgi:hypothetical protein